MRQSWITAALIALVMQSADAAVARPSAESEEKLDSECW